MRPEKKKVSLTEDEKTIMDILIVKGEMLLSDLKIQVSLSGKKWDKSTKNLSKLGLFQVEKREDGLFAKHVS